MGCTGTGLICLFNNYIRLRDAEPITGLVTCITCGKKVKWDRIHAGHFLHGKFTRASYHEQNVHGQCTGCNLNSWSANEITRRYRDFIVSKYGVSVLRSLRRLWGQHLISDKSLYRKLRIHYRSEIRRLLKLKKLRPTKTLRIILKQQTI